MFFLQPVSPFRLDLTVWALRRRPENAMDRWDGQTYCRVLPLPAAPVEVAVTQIKPPETPELRVLVKGQPLRSPVKAAGHILSRVVPPIACFFLRQRQGPI